MEEKRNREDGEYGKIGEEKRRKRQEKMMKEDCRGENRRKKTI